MIEVSAEENAGSEPVAVESKHVEGLSERDFSKELVRIIAENEELSKEHVASRSKIVLNMENLSVSPEDFE